MHELGFIRIGTAIPKVKVADVEYNANEIISLSRKAYKEHIEILLFPELCLSGYTCGDLFFQENLLASCEYQLARICSKTKEFNMLIVIGVPVTAENKIFNSAVIINNGKILGVVPKSYLPNYNEFYEKRWFSSSANSKLEQINLSNEKVAFGKNIIFQHVLISDLCIGIEICEDLWAPIPPSSFHCLEGATLILNPSASNDLVGKSDYRRSLVAQQSARCIAGYAYCSAGFGESTTDVVYGGHAMIFENGSILAESEKYKFDSQLVYCELDIKKLSHERRRNNVFSDSLGDVAANSYTRINFNTQSNIKEISRKYNPYPFIPSNNNLVDERCEEIFNIQVSGLAKRITHIGTNKMVVGISGGLDSTLALLVCVGTCDKLGISREYITAITMPGFGTTDRTYNNAIKLMEILGVNIREISIKEACIQHFEDIGHDMKKHDVTYENTQARERTQILMDISNQERGIVIGTGDLSELALGWATYNGDHMSMYSVNSGVPKTLVRYVVKWIAESNIERNAKDILLDILDTPVSPELLPPDDNGNIKQKTEEVVGPYDLHDFFLYEIVRFGFSPKKIYYIACKAFQDKYDKKTIYKWLKNFYKRFFAQQFKRSCLPDGPKVGSICLSPRGDWRMPSDASVNIWIKEIEEIDAENKEIGN